METNVSRKKGMSSKNISNNCKSIRDDNKSKFVRDTKETKRFINLGMFLSSYDYQDYAFYS